MHGNIVGPAELGFKCKIFWCSYH